MRRPCGWKSSAQAARTLLEETIWSSRCVVCDRPGAALCAHCLRSLSYIDLWQACPACGAPYGRLACTECNRFTLEQKGLKSLPYRHCTSAVTHDDAARRIVTAYKDGGERRLALTIAKIAAATVSPSLAAKDTVLTYIPASTKARKRRGFDHTEETASHLAQCAGLELVRLFEPPDGRDQRGLSRRQRLSNMHLMRVLSRRRGGIPPRVLVYDDVSTTGSTLFAASTALREAGCQEVDCVTFSRV